MIIFSCQGKDEEARDEENDDSRKDSCLYRYQRCRMTKIGDKWQTVETFFLTRINQSQNITKLIEERRNSRYHVGSLLISHDSEKSVITTT